MVLYFHCNKLDISVVPEIVSCIHFDDVRIEIIQTRKRPHLINSQVPLGKFLFSDPGKYLENVPVFGMLPTYYAESSSVN
jgi:hypothetical protein